VCSSGELTSASDRVGPIVDDLDGDEGFTRALRSRDVVVIRNPRHDDVTGDGEPRSIGALAGHA
jgi:hypothetical protein